MLRFAERVGPNVESQRLTAAAAMPGDGGWSLLRKYVNNDVYGTAARNTRTRVRVAVIHCHGIVGVRARVVKRPEIRSLGPKGDACG